MCYRRENKIRSGFVGESIYVGGVQSMLKGEIYEILPIIACKTLME